MTNNDRTELAAIREQLIEAQKGITEILERYAKKTTSAMSTIQTIRGEENDD